MALSLRQILLGIRIRRKWLHGLPPCVCAWMYLVRMRDCSLGFRAHNKLYLDALTEFTVSCDGGRFLYRQAMPLRIRHETRTSINAHVLGC